jgi:predicted N-formylglutamate amidohydrolase
VGDRIDRVVAGVQRLFEAFSTHVRDERIVRYLIDQLRKGRDFDEILRDPYVVNNTTTTDRAHLLENSEVLRDIEDCIAAEFSDYRRQLSESDRTRG